MNKIKTKISTLLLSTIIATFCTSLFSMNFAYADPTTPATTTTPTTPSQDLSNATFSLKDNLNLDNNQQPKTYLSSDNPIVSFVLSVIDFAITIMGSIAVLLFIIAGFQFMVASGNPTKTDEAKDTVKYAAIGLVVALMSYIIAIFVQSLFATG